MGSAGACLHGSDVQMRSPICGTTRITQGPPSDRFDSLLRVLIVAHRNSPWAAGGGSWCLLSRDDPRGCESPLGTAGRFR